MNKPKLQALKREIFGRKVKSLREKNIIPANVFGDRDSSLAISVNLKDFRKVYDEVGETGLIDLVIENSTLPVLINNISFEPVSGKILHIDFRQVNLKEKLTANVPVELIGESPAEKQGLGTVVSYLTEIEVEALPSDLPEKFVIDVSNLSEVDQSIYVKDIKTDSDKVKITLDPETIVVKVEEQKMEEVSEEASSSESQDGAKSAENTKEELQSQDS
ncbi:MAG: 50S ribosomal protein L25 [Patescibacteria group bacterium]|nr:50S ribosomal protein L25 [Patescibacteria group bacterium]